MSTSLGPVQSLLDALDRADLSGVAEKDRVAIETAIRRISPASDASLYDAAPEMLALIQRSHIPHNATLHMEPEVKGCPGCNLRALMAKVEGK